MLNKHLTIAVAAVATLSAGSAWAQGAPRFKAAKLGEITLGGTFKAANGQTYTARVLVDEIGYREGTSHSVYLKPEDYKLDTDFIGAGWRINCPFDGPGVKTVAFNRAPSVTCIWKQGNGASAPSGTVELTRVNRSTNPLADLAPKAPLTKTPFLNFGATVVSGSTIVDATTGATVTFSLTLDRLDYRNGNSHKAWTRPEEYDVTFERINYTKPVQSLACASNDGTSFTNTRPGALAIASGKAPVVVCTWKDGPSSKANTYTVVLD